MIYVNILNPNLVNRLAAKESETVEATPEVAENVNVQGEGPLLRLEHCPDVEPVCQQCQQVAAENEQLRSDKTQLEKQLNKSREEAERISNLVKDMEHKWTQVAKDYEKQVSRSSDHLTDRIYFILKTFENDVGDIAAQ